METGTLGVILMVSGFVLMGFFGSWMEAAALVLIVLGNNLEIGARG